MRKVSKYSASLFSGLCLIMVFTASHAETTRGSSELSLYGNVFHTSDFTLASANIDYGYYFTNQVRGIFGASAFGSTEGSDSINFGARTGLVYDFKPQGNTVYLGAVVNVFDVSEASDTAAGYVFLGYRQWIGESAAVFYQGGYARPFRGGGDVILGEFGLTIFFN